METIAEYQKRTKTRLGKLDRVAFAACETIAARAAEGETVHFSVRWNKSRPWGNCPAVYWHGERAAYASGCGYEKRSAVLAEFLRFLAPNGLAGGGAGFGSLQEELRGLGYALECSFEGQTEEGYTIGHYFAGK